MALPMSKIRSLEVGAANAGCRCRASLNGSGDLGFSIHKSSQSRQMMIQIALRWFPGIGYLLFHDTDRSAGGVVEDVHEW
jgi:hypothetical protein